MFHKLWVVTYLNSLDPILGWKHIKGKPLFTKKSDV
jgi:hypothetical protein